ERSAYDPLGTDRTARRSRAAFDRARAAGDPPPEPPARRDAYGRSPANAVAGESPQDDRCRGAAGTAGAHAAGWLDTPRRERRRLEPHAECHEPRVPHGPYRAAAADDGAVPLAAR